MTALGSAFTHTVEDEKTGPERTPQGCDHLSEGFATEAAAVLIPIALIALAAPDHVALEGHRSPNHARGCGLAASPEGPIEAVSIDCTLSTDTGYIQGEPFEITLVHVDGVPVERRTANGYWVMATAAEADGVVLRVVSGFRTMEEQAYLYMCYQCGCCNDGVGAAQPGFSNHQSGRAVDLNVEDPGVLDWLREHAAEYGFKNTTPSENWHWEWWGEEPRDVMCELVYPPAGAVDAASCDDITGWAQDPDAPDQPVELDVAFDGAPGEPQTIQVSVVADESRDDLCEELGSCDHGFTVPFPRGLQDGRPHEVRVFAHDDAAGRDAELSVSTPTIECAAPALPSGVRRRVPDPTAFAAWRFDALWDVAHVDDELLAAVPEGPAFLATPVLARTANDPTVWLVDDDHRREVSETAATAWRLDLASATTITDAARDELVEGTPLRAELWLAQGSVAQVWVIDDPQAGPGGSESSGGDDGTSGGSGDGTDGANADGTDASQGCACQASGRHGGALWLAAVLLGLRRRRRRGPA